MAVNIFASHNQSHPKTRETAKPKRIFSSIRFRILAWYFFLTVCTVLVSVGVTRHIFCELLKSRSLEALVSEVSKFDRLVAQVNQSQSDNQLEAIVEQVLPLHVPARNEYILAFVDGEIINHPQLPLPDAIAQNSELIQAWTTVSDLTHSEFILPDGPIYYVAQPLEINQSQGVIVAVRDARADYQTGTRTIILVVQVATVVLTLFLAIAWITAERVLLPLRRVTETAREITQTDMTKRISVVGNDEIAELGATFNAMLDRLQSAFECQQEFLKDAGHELRTPITIIQGHLEVLKYRPEKQPETIELVTDELHRMSRLVNDLLLIAKAEQPHFLRIKLEELDWFTEELYFKAQAIAQRDWRLESKGLSPVAVDRGRLTQAVMNLVQNAVRHTKQGDTIALGSAVQKEYAYLWVRDTGEGIAPEDQERIFDRFARASDGDRYSGSEGAGLGLAIVEAIANAHNGWVELDSTLGIGTTFTIVFPISQEAADVPNCDRRRQPPRRRIYRSRTTGARLHNSGR